MASRSYLPRTVEQLVTELLQELPAIMLTGPRASGKTTTARQYAADAVALDRPAEAAIFWADPDAALRGRARPLLLDEWQEVPGVLGAVKRAVDNDPAPGQFLLTGSVRADLETATWPGTGRVVRVPMYGMTVRELAGAGRTRTFLERLASEDGLATPPDVPDIPGYVDLVLKSGFPEPALRMPERARARWFDGYIEQILTRDAAGVDGGRDPSRLRRYFESYALNTAGVVSDATLFEAAGLNRKTALAYERLLASLFVVDALPAWTSNRLKRLALRAKRHVVEPALAVAALRLNAQTIMRDGELVGRLLDSFVTAQLRAELAASDSRPRLYHLRDDHGRREVDLIVELAGGMVFGLEVKAAAAPGPQDARHLAWLRDELGERFVRGIVFHTGPRIFELGDRILAVPICALWA